MKKYSRKLFFIELIIFIFLSGCNSWIEDFYKTDAVVKYEKEPEPEKEEIIPDKENIVPPSEQKKAEREWTIMMYMSADNDLEPEAIEDICEIEFSKIDTDTVTIIALLDRHPGYDISNSNWTGAKIYKIESQKSAFTGKIESTEIDCNELGLKAGISPELDMSSGYVLESFLKFCRSEYPASKYGLVMWGHGSGWRSAEIEEGGALNCGYKGFAYDSTSDDYMTLYQFGNALKAGLKNMTLDFIGFDTCFGAEMEVFYEIKDCAKYAAGSEGLIAAKGWNYTQLFNDFAEAEDKSSEALCHAVINQFKNQYEYKNRASICAVKLSNMQAFFENTENLWKQYSGFITNRSIRDSVMEVLYSGGECKTEKYTYGNAGSDIYLDVCSMNENLYEYFMSNELSTEIKENLMQNYEKFKLSSLDFVVDSWASDRLEGGIGVYFASINDSFNLSVNHPAAYVKGKTVDQLLFVQASNAYVPDLVSGNSILNKLFYTRF